MLRGWPISAPGGHLILVGLPGAGKSTVGRGVAKALGWPFVDLDAEIVRREGQSVSALFAAHGEGYFRHLERRETERLRGGRATVVASGGGWPTVPETVALVRPPARLAYLKVSPAAAMRRLQRTIHTRPLLRDNPLESLSGLLAARKESYEAADIVIDTELHVPEHVTAELLAWFDGGPSG